MNEEKITYIKVYGEFKLKEMLNCEYDYLSLCNEGDNNTEEIIESEFNEHKYDEIVYNQHNKLFLINQYLKYTYDKDGCMEIIEASIPLQTKTIYELLNNNYMYDNLTLVKTNKEGISSDEFCEVVDWWEQFNLNNTVVQLAELIKDSRIKDYLTLETESDFKKFYTVADCKYFEPELIIVI